MRLVSPTSLSIAALSGILICAALPASADITTKHKKTTTTATAHANVKRVSAHSTKHAKAVHVKFSPSHAPMDTQRATAIQTALIKSGYMSGEATGTWDSQSTAAMQKLQSDNGWQTKIVPDSRALIKLGLGPQSPATSLSANN